MLKNSRLMSRRSSDKTLVDFVGNESEERVEEKHASVKATTLSEYYQVRQSIDRWAAENKLDVSQEMKSELTMRIVSECM